MGNVCHQLTLLYLVTEDTYLGIATNLIMLEAYCTLSVPIKMHSTYNCRGFIIWGTCLNFREQVFDRNDYFARDYVILI